MNLGITTVFGTIVPMTSLLFVCVEFVGSWEVLGIKFDIEVIRGDIKGVNGRTVVGGGI